MRRGSRRWLDAPGDASAASRGWLTDLAGWLSGTYLACSTCANCVSSVSFRSDTAQNDMPSRIQ